MYVAKFSRYCFDFLTLGRIVSVGRYSRRFQGVVGGYYASAPVDIHY